MVKTDSGLTAPVVNLNGTDGEELLEQLVQAGQAVNAALNALVNAGPNGRDYPDGAAALSQAQTEFGARFVRLRSVHEELAELADAVYQQNAARAAQKRR